MKAERKPKVIRIRNAWITLIQQYQAEEGKEVAWENILKVLVYLCADKKEVKTYEEIAAALNLSEMMIKRSVWALEGIDFGDLTITKKLAWFKNDDGEFRVKGQSIDIGLDFS